MDSKVVREECDDVTVVMLIDLNDFKTRMWARRMTQSVMHLLGKHEYLSSIFNMHVKKPGMVVCIYKPSTGEMQTGGCLELSGQPV